MGYNKTRKRNGGSDCRFAVLNPRFGGKRATKRVIKKNRRQRGKGCGCGASTAFKPLMSLPAGVTQGPLTLELKGGGCGCGAAPAKPPASSELLQNGGACPCQAVAALPKPLNGGYRPTKRNLKYLKKWKRGESIGFTMRSSLKAKGLIPRANGTKRVSNKYRRA